MPSYIFDIETDGFLETVTKIHSLVLKDMETGEIFSCHDQPGATYSISDGLQKLADADLIVGHNVIKFDIPVIQKLFPQWRHRDVRDTLTLARVGWPEIKQTDFPLVKSGRLPNKLHGSYSLEAFGYRIGNYKGDFKGPWETWTLEMQEYCEQDVEVTFTLWTRLQQKQIPDAVVQLEHDVAWLCAQMERNGFRFLVDQASKLYAELAAERETVRAQLRETFGIWAVKDREVIPKASNSKIGFQKGVPYTKVKFVEFNPASRHHVINRLQTLYGWEPDPEEYTDGGQPKIDDDILARLTYPPAPLLARYYLLEKRIAQIAEGEQAWLKVERNGFIHGSINTNGAVTGRATHAFPNIGQVPSCGAPYGRECRSLFTVPDGWVLVGADASGLELRCLGHFMARYDEGAYVRIVTQGDVHTENQKAAGLPTRNNAKTFIYAFLYGAGDKKIGMIVTPLGSVDEKKRTGKRLKSKFLKGLPALKHLIDAVAASADKGWIKGLDGRRLTIRKKHAALNTLLQSAGAILCKKWMVMVDQELRARGYRHGWDGDYAFCAWVHDEIQVAARTVEIGEEIGKIAVECAAKVGDVFNFRCPLTGEYKIGKTWADTH